MAIPKANQRAVNKYVKNNYDRINVTFPKGMRERIKAVADANNTSVNSYITQLVIADMELKGVSVNE